MGESISIKKRKLNLKIHQRQQLFHYMLLFFPNRFFVSIVIICLVRLFKDKRDWNLSADSQSERVLMENDVIIIKKENRQKTSLLRNYYSYTRTTINYYINHMSQFRQHSSESISFRCIYTNSYSKTFLKLVFLIFLLFHI